MRKQTQRPVQKGRIFRFEVSYLFGLLRLTKELGACIKPLAMAFLGAAESYELR